MAKILILDDDPDIRLLLAELAERMGHKPGSSGKLLEGLAMAKEDLYDLILLDLDFPEGNGLDVIPDLLQLNPAPEVIIITGVGSAEAAELAFTHGAWDYVQKPFLIKEVSLPITRALQYHEEKASPLSPTVLHRHTIIGNSPDIQRCLEEVAKAAITDSSVLIHGETGTGKELFARAIHDNSRRRAQGNFVTIDCGALPETLVESILFGHEKGAFTGARESKKGLIAQADGGTLFMDEIGEIPPAIQKTLLRALQEHKIRPLGGSKELAIDFRLVAATNRNLEAMVEKGEFRQDLLYRICGIEIQLPPLRERSEDIHDIAYHTVKELGKSYSMDTKGISSAFLEALEQYTWPGNVRELMNVLEHALANAGSDPTLVPIHLPPKYRTALLTQQEQQSSVSRQQDTLSTWAEYRQAMEYKYLRSLVMIAQGDWRAACTISGLSKTRFYELIKKHGLSLSAGNA